MKWERKENHHWVDFLLAFQNMHMFQENGL